MSERALRRWAWVSLVAGAVWLLFSVLPTFVTTIIGLPIALLAFAAGLWARGRAREAADHGSLARAHWGLGLGCAGCAWQAVYYLFLAGLGVALLAGAVSAWLQGTPAPR